MEYYIDIFIESLLASSIVPFQNDPTFVAMYSFAASSFGSFNMELATTAALVGISIGMFFNFMVGRLLLRLYKIRANKNELPKDRYNKYAHRFTRYFLILLPFSWLPLLNFLVVAAGFFGVKARVALPLVVGGEMVRYGYYLFKLY
ncbi:MAG: hypothetical protein R3D71_04245 [Rickettsiales bacterium]